MKQNAHTSSQNSQHTGLKPGVQSGRNLFFGPVLQPGLTVNQPGAVYEQETGAMAAVMRTKDGESPVFFKPAASAVQRRCGHCEEKEKQTQRTESGGQPAEAGSEPEARVTGLSGGQILPVVIRHFFESRTGYDHSRVRVDAGATAAKPAQSTKASACASGNKVAFTGERHSPGTDTGKKLQAHEPTHVVRQQPQPTVAREGENESYDHDFLREHLCINPPTPGRNGIKAFSTQELARANFGLWNARSIASRAYMNLGHRDPYHLRLASRAFGTAVSFDVLDRHVSRILNVTQRLHIGQNLLAGNCDNQGCKLGDRNAVAMTMDDLSAVVLCPFYFVQPARTLATTLLHEAGHMANIDVHWQPGNERYCRNDDQIDCQNICSINGENLLENVDAWMRFIYCLAMS